MTQRCQKIILKITTVGPEKIVKRTNIWAQTVLGTIILKCLTSMNQKVFKKTKEKKNRPKLLSKNIFLKIGCHSLDIFFGKGS